MTMITRVTTPPAQKTRPNKTGGKLGSFALFAFAIGGWLLFFLSFLFLHHPMSNAYSDTNDDSTQRHLRAPMPQKWNTVSLRNKTSTNSPSSNKNVLSRDYKPSRSENNAIYKPTNKTMAACLLVNDDTIKLTEWIAYHYTTLPLSHLIVAIDPNSLLEDKIKNVLDLWKGRLQYLDVWTHDSWMTLNKTSGWRQSIYKDPNATNKEYMHWYLQPQSVKGRFHRHNRRQQHFAIQCMRKMKSLNATWVLNTDTDEFLTYNYLEDDEDANNFDAYRKRESEALQQAHEERIRNLRKRVLPIRLKLPDLASVTIADFMNHFQIPGACFHVPALQFSARESRLVNVTKDVPPQVDARKLMTLRHRKYGDDKSGRFTKPMIDVSKVPWDLLVDEQVVTIHTPIRDVCPYNGISGSGYDYISSVFRLHHYAGTFRSFQERQNDGRRTRSQTFHLRDVEPVGENDDLRPWIQAFVNKVGIADAVELLSPLDRAYEQRDLDAVF